MTIIIYILGITISMYAFSLCFPKAYKEAPYWKRFFCLISTKITNYYFKTTPGKICLWIIRANSAAYTLYTFGLPIIEAGKTRESYWVCLQWEEPNLYAFLVYLFINGVVGVIYFSTQKYGGKEIKEDLSRQENLIKENASKLNKIDENTEENNQLLKRLLGTVPDTYQSILISSVKTTINDIKNLNFKSALNHLEWIRNKCEEYCPQNNYLFSLITYWEACCYKYTDINKAKEKYKQAYLQNKNFASKEIKEGYIFALCIENKIEEAKNESIILLNDYNESEWLYIPEFLLSENKNDFFLRKIPNDHPLLKKILSESIIIAQHLNLKFDLDIYPQVQFIETELNYNTLPIWILNLSIELTHFFNGLVLKFNEETKPQNLEKFHKLICTFRNLENYHEIENIIIDLDLYYAFTGFLINKESHWIDI